MLQIPLIILILAINFSSAKMSHGNLSPLDPSSYSRPELARVTGLHLEIGVNFERQVLSGHVDLAVDKIDDNTNELILDCKDLEVLSVLEKDLNREVKFTISDTVPEFGSKLTIELPSKDGKVYAFQIKYSTSRNASGLQWLQPEQTAGKQHPYMFSQFQPIHARSFVPCQDTPAVKTKYSAEITVPKEMTALMSALSMGKQFNMDTITYKFVQNVPIPSYLIALVVGALESRKIGPRSTVWAEKEQIEDCAKEFDGTEHQLKTAEDICGPYVWGVYDLLVLPPSFIFGGMENPCLTFVTPTLLAGDKSLVSVVAHEISHSWTGNLVTNRNFEHFWLNEGFTMFIERKINGRLTNAQEQDFSAIRGSTALKETIEELGPNNPLTKLVVNLTGVHPDDAFSGVPYEKGYIFLRYLENTVGGPAIFEPFLRTYFDTFKYQSIDTGDFKNCFEEYFKKKNIAVDSIDWDKWLYTPGMPTTIPKYDTSLLDACELLRKKILDWNIDVSPNDLSEKDLAALNTNQIIYVLQKLIEDPPQDVNKLQLMEKLFGFKETRNAEIKYRWLRVGLRAHWKEKIQQTLDWVNVVGRMKYVRPLYREMYKWEEARPIAINNYNENKKYMMHVLAYTVAKDLHLDA